MKILIFGSKGYIGGRMLEAWPDAVGTDAWIGSKEDALAEIDRVKPDAVMNAAGIVGKPNVDWCETNQLETIQGNTILPLLIAEACQERGIYMLNLGTGCVFYGYSTDPRGWKESDFANPTAVYTRSKYAADLLLTTFPNVGIARLRMPIDDRPSPANLIGKLASFKQVMGDMQNSVTVLQDLVDACRQLIEKRGTGIFHTVNPGIERHRDLLGLYKEHVDPSHSCEWIQESDLLGKGLVTKKRSNTLLQSDRLKALGIEMRPVDVALRDTMIKYAANVTRSKQHVPAPITSRSPRMKGIICAGGKGTRLAPLTNITNKHLLPVGSKQMVMYPLQTMLEAGIRDIMVVTGPDHAGDFMNLLGSGEKFGCRLTYRIQDESGGIAQALGMAEEFIGQDHCTVILGDNIFEDNFLAPISSFQGGGLIFYKPVADAQRFGVVELDSMGRVLSIEEKPQNPKSNFASVGLYVFDHRVFDIIKTLKPSARGEYEITDIQKAYLTNNELVAKPIRGFWTDAGTFDSLKRASDFFEKR
ncbi:MAG: sugar phosphate nucleotidyltransferase [Candidatus Uhrbacteria bacterium]